MKETLYHSLVHRSRAELEEEGAGNVMTKAILDVDDDCAEGMRIYHRDLRYRCGTGGICGNVVYSMTGGWQS